jgi:hypothetical protein
VAIKIRRGGSPAARKRWEKRFRSSWRTWGWLESKKGSSEAAVRLETELAWRGSEGCDGVPTTGVQEGEGELVRELRHGDVVLMVLLAREKKGWSFGSTRNKTAAASKIAGAVF